MLAKFQSKDDILSKCGARKIQRVPVSRVEEIKNAALDKGLELIPYLFLDKVCQTEPHLQEKSYAMADLFIDSLPDMMRNQLKKVS